MLQGQSVCRHFDGLLQTLSGKTVNDLVQSQTNSPAGKSALSTSFTTTYFLALPDKQMNFLT